MNVEYRAFHGPSDWGWVIKHNPILRTDNTNGIMAIDSDKNETIGAVIFDNWTPNTVQAHIIATTSMLFKHGFLEEAFDYAFNISGRKYMLGIIPSDNEKSVKLVKSIGFKEAYRLKDGWADGIDIIVFEISRDNCRFLPQLKEVANG